MYLEVFGWVGWVEEGICTLRDKEAGKRRRAAIRRVSRVVSWE